MEDGAGEREMRQEVQSQKPERDLQNKTRAVSDYIDILHQLFRRYGILPW